MPSFPLRASATLALLLAAACGSSETGKAGPDAASACSALAATCLVDQQACVSDASGARCEACAEGQYTRTGEACEPIGGEVLTHAFADFTVGAGEEQLGNCQSWTLNNETELWINAVELVQNEASHHSNWTYVPDDQFDGPDGVWKCKDRDYSQLAAALSGGVLYAQSTQAAKEVQKFPNGAAVRVPPHARIIGDVHLLNTSSESITGHAKLSIYALPADEVTIKLAPFHLTFEVLDIPPKARSRFEATCNIADQFAAKTKGPLDMSLFYALPHTHALGRRMFVEVAGGPNDGQSLLDVEGFNGEARGVAYDPPVVLDGAVGLKFGCEFDNPRDEAIHWGFDDQEMCEMLGFAESAIGFEGSINELDPPTMDGDTAVYTGPCSMFAALWGEP